MSILVVCLNPALDVTYHVDSLVPGSSHPVTSQHDRAGGKGVNVARVLRQLGTPALLLGFGGGRRGERLAEELSAAGVDARWVPISGETRRTVTLVDSADATVLLEPGPHCAPADWTAFVAEFERALEQQVDLVALAGSLPRGAPIDAYAQLTTLASSRSVRTIVDASGPELQAALGVRPYLAKPNTVEAAAVFTGDLVEAVRGAGALNALVSEGAAGLRAILDGVAYSVHGPVIEGNPTGAGDALTAAVASGIVAGIAWPEILREAAAIAAAAVTVPYAGGFDPVAAGEVLPLITVEEH